ncbi:MAG: hypothetical protein AAF266_05130 [Planctomycetota bacterium]
MDPQGPAADELRDVAERSRGVIGELRSTMARAAEERQSAVEHLGAESARLVESLAAQIATELSGDLARQHDEQLAVEREELDRERSKLQAERDAWIAEREEWESVRTQIESELASLEADLKAETERLDRDQKEKESKSQAKADQRLAEANQALEATEQQLADAQLAIAELTAALEEANTRLVAAAEAEAEHATLQEKFDLALADLQSHREHVAELDQQLAERPEPDGSADAELAALRQERDDLRRQLDESADAAIAAPTDADTEELRARFELAVEDVRRLKTENAELREQAASGGGAGSGEESGWEAQKRRLLASLEDEGESENPQRAEERASIAGTVQITDEVVAEKDRQIQALQSQLDGMASPEVEGDNEATTALLDEDEVIQAERERLAQLEAEWQEKLRSAELELSVERAKITRTQSELAEQQIELETLRAALGQAADDVPSDKRRNWMNKLGLGNDDG